MSASRVLCVGVGLLLCAACADHWDGGGRRQDLPKDDRGVGMSSGASASLGGDSAATAGGEATDSLGGSGGSGGSGAAGSSGSSGSGGSGGSGG